jgi:DNA polymerase III subunit epsilon
MPDRAWWDGPLVGLDLETTAPSPEEARIVTAALVTVGPLVHTDGSMTPELTPEGVRVPRDVQRRTWLADPGVPIPEEATAVHGVTTEHAREHGRPIHDVVLELVAALNAAPDGAPLVVFNAPYDLTVLDREFRRHAAGAQRGGLAMMPGLAGLRVVDPFVLDKHLDRYRKSYPHGHDAESAKAAGIPSSRTLAGMCAHYRVTLDGAHDAAFDALAAVRLAWRICSSAHVVRRARNPAERAELVELRAEWARVRGDLGALHDYQHALAILERERFAEYKASIGEHDEAARIRAEVGWPVLEVPT